MKLKLNLQCLTILCAGLIFQLQAPAQQISRKVKETILTKLYDSTLVNNSFSFTNDMRSIAYCIYFGKKQRVVINEFKGKSFDSVCIPLFSPDGKSFIYHALEGKRWLWMKSDNKELISAPGELITYVRYSPDSKAIAYVINKDQKSIMVFNGTRSNPYDAINYNSITFSNDGQKILYTANLKDKQFNVFDGREGTYFDQVGFPVLNSTGDRLAYWAINNKKSYAVVDNKLSKPFEEVSSIIFNANGKHFAFHAMINNKHVVVLDSTISEKYENAHTICFSPDGSKLAYGIETTETGKDGFKQYISLDGKKSVVYETVVEGSFRFSSDSKSLAFEAENHDAFFMVNQGKEGKHFSDVLQSTTVFSADNQRIAYAVENDSKRFVVSDNIEGIPYQDIFYIAFSPNNKQLIYSARINNKELVVVDGKNGSMYDSLPSGGQIVFDSPNSFHYLARKGNNIILVEETLVY